jgi:hypothetical protein
VGGEEVSPSARLESATKADHMKSWKLFGLVFLGVLAVMLVYPGIPIGSHVEIRTSASARYATLTCYYLHWDGIHHKDIDASDAISSPYIAVNGPHISVNNTPCWLFK